MTIDWTDEQRAVFRHDPAEPARLLAGPGTGKSATVVAWVDQLVGREPRVPVRLLTFTRAATAELAKKIADHPAAAALRPSTIHSFAIGILLRNPGSGNFPKPLRIADDWETEEIVHPSLAKRIKVRVTRISDLFRELAANWEALDKRTDPRVRPEERARFLGAWQEHREVLGYTLLAEIPFALRNALLEQPDLVGLDFTLLVVDEYQDLNACDLDVLKALSERGCAVVAVGDDDQSIYSFRRAHPAGIRRFLRDYEGARDYTLSVTHRCGRKIIDWAAYVIAGDSTRPASRGFPRPADGSPDGEVALLRFKSEKAEAEGIAELTRALVEREGVEPAEILILLRGDYRGMFSRPIKTALEARGLPSSDPDEPKRVMATPANRLFLASVRRLLHANDSRYCQ